MSSLITQPENLTKDRLKAELKKQGVTFSPTQPKGYYVQLYRERLMTQKGSATRRQRSEFSSDEEIGRRAQQTTTPRSKRYSKVATPEKYLGDVSKMSDSELARELKEYNVSIGPITSSTRDVYRRKLAKVKAEKTRAVSQSSSVVTVASESDEEFSSSSEDADPKPQEKPAVQSSYRLRSRGQSERTKPASGPVVGGPPRTVDRMQSQKQPRTQPVPAGQRARGWWSWLVWLFCLLLTMAVAFLAGYLLFDVYLRGWGDSKVLTWIAPYLPSHKLTEAGEQGTPPAQE